MKICVCGKGGSGKSTLVALLADAFEKGGKKVLVLDSDESNSSLYWMLGLDRPPLALMDSVGGKKAVQEKMMANFSSGKDMSGLRIWKAESIASHEIPDDYVAKRKGCRLVAIGKIHQSLEGCACPMGTITKEFLKKLRLAPDEVALVDMEAGIEHFGRGVESSVDRVVCVVEPSLESVFLAKKIMELTEAAGAIFKGAILNKIYAADQETLLIRKSGEAGVPVIGIVEHHPAIQSAGLQGAPPRAETAEADMAKIADAIVRDEELSALRA